MKTTAWMVAGATAAVFGLAAVTVAQDAPRRGQQRGECLNEECQGEGQMTRARERQRQGQGEGAANRVRRQEGRGQGRGEGRMREGGGQGRGWHRDGTGDRRRARDGSCAESEVSE